MSKRSLLLLSAELWLALIIFTASVSLSTQIETAGRKTLHQPSRAIFSHNLTKSKKQLPSAQECFAENSCETNSDHNVRLLQTSTFPKLISITDPQLIVTPNNSVIDTTDLPGKLLQMAVFDLRALEAAVITVDLRFLENSLEYETDWNLIFLVSTDTIIPGEVVAANQIPLPETFLNLENKFTVNEFIFQAQNHIQFAIYIQIVNPVYIFYEYMFFNTTSVEVIEPYRASPPSENGDNNTLYSFAAVIFQSTEVDLPVNIPVFASNGSYPNYYFDLATDGKTELSRHTLDSANTFNPSQLFWSQVEPRTHIMMPYLPFFSNCKGYGKYIPIFTLFEQHPNCVLYPKEETVPINPLGFGSFPVADTCENIKIECAYDENFDNPTDQTPWYALEASETVFYMSPFPMSAAEMESDLELNPQNFVPVTVTNTTAKADQYPTNISLSFHYFQVSETQKELIRVYISFDNYQNATADQLVGNTTFPYTLTVSFVPMSHTELIISFGFGSSVYLLTYVAVGLVACIIMFIFLVYHLIVSRQKKKTTRKYWKFVVILVKPLFNGVLLATIPSAIIITIIGLLMQGKFWGVSLISSCETSDCVLSPFDLYHLTGYDDPSSKDFDVIRSGRTGTAFLAAGVYFIIVGARLLIPDIPEENAASNDPSESYPQRNTWYPRPWLRSSLIYFMVLLMVAMLGIVYYSFTDLFGSILWYNMIGYKIMTIIIEFVGDKTFDNKLIVNTITIYLGVLQNLTNFGAADFLDFITSYFIELAILMAERAYLASLVDKLNKYLEKQALKGINFLIKLLGEGGQDEDDDANSEGSPRKNKELSHANISDSNIILTDESDQTVFSLDESLDDKFDRIAAVSKEYNDVKDPETDDELEKAFKQRAAEKDRNNRIRETKPTGTTGTAGDGNDELDPDDHEQILEKIITVSPDALILVYTPFFIGVTWVYYDQLQLGPQYAITEADYIYYWLWTVFFLPFQVIIDVLSMNIMEIFEEVDIYDYLCKAELRFKNRSTFWKGSLPENNPNLPGEHRDLDSWGFSPQYYFAHVIFLNGPLFMVLGILMYLMNEYDPFPDGANKCIFLTIIICCFLIERTLIYLGKKLKIWSLEKNTEKESNSAPGTQMKFSLDLKKLKSEEEEKIVQAGDDLQINHLEDVLDNKPYGTPRPEIKIPPINFWDKLQEIERRDEIFRVLKDDIVNVKCKSEEFKSTFLDANKNWLKSHIKEVLSPLSLKNKKTEILNAFRQSYDKLVIKAGEHINQAEDETNQAKNKMMDYAPQRKIKKNQINWQLETMIRHWKTKAVRRVQIRQKVAGLIEVMAPPCCEYCGSRWGIRAECMQDIEEIFNNFLQETPDQNWGIWSEIAWQDYFKEHAVMRSVCFECDEQIIANHQKLARREIERREIERRKLNEMKAPGSMDTLPEEGTFRKPQSTQQQITRKSSDSKSEQNSELQADQETLNKQSTIGKILTQWLAQARVQMPSYQKFPTQSSFQE